MRSGLVVIRPGTQGPSEGGRRMSFAGLGAFRELTARYNWSTSVTERLESVNKGANPTEVCPRSAMSLVFAFSGRYWYRVGKRDSLEVNSGRGKRR